MMAVLHDAVAAVLAWSCAYLLRFNFELPDNFAVELQHTLYFVVPLQLVCNSGIPPDRLLQLQRELQALLEMTRQDEKATSR